MYTARERRGDVLGEQLGPMILAGAVRSAERRTQRDRGELLRLVGDLDRCEAVELPVQGEDAWFRVERLGGGGVRAVYRLVEGDQVQATNPDNPAAITCGGTIAEAREQLADAEAELRAAAEASRSRFVGEHGDGDGDW